MTKETFNTISKTHRDRLIRILVREGILKGDAEQIKQEADKIVDDQRKKGLEQYGKSIFNQDPAYCDWQRYLLEEIVDVGEYSAKIVQLKSKAK